MSDKELTEDACFVDSNIWLYILLPGQDVDKSKTARELVHRRGVTTLFTEDMHDNLLVDNRLTIMNPFRTL